MEAQLYHSYSSTFAGALAAAMAPQRPRDLPEPASDGNRFEWSEGHVEASRVKPKHDEHARRNRAKKWNGNLKSQSVPYP